MPKHFDDELMKLKERVLAMGALAERNVHRAAEAFAMRDRSSLPALFDSEGEVNELHIEIDERVIELIARRQPVGKDLRFLLVATRVAGDVERVSDQAVNIAKGCERLAGEEPLGRAAVITVMAEKALGMLRKALDAFVRADAEAARQVLLADDEVDGLRDQTFREMLTYMMEDARTISRALSQILIGQSLERIADHATNVAEEVIYFVEGREVRHRHDQKVGTPIPSTPRKSRSKSSSRSDSRA